MTRFMKAVSIFIVAFLYISTENCNGFSIFKRAAKLTAKSAILARTAGRRTDAQREGNGNVEYSEFEDMLASQMTGDHMKHNFKNFDTNGDGYITSDELALVMIKTFGGKSYPQKEIDDMIKSADLDSDGRVNYDEFVQLAMPK